MLHPVDLPSVSNVAETIRLAVAPVFLLAGIGAFLNVCAARLARVIDRSRQLESRIDATSGEDHARILFELRTLDRRITIVNWCIFFAVLAACLVCLVVILLFAGQLLGNRFELSIALTFVGAMLSIALGYALFILETRIGSSVIRVRNELLNHREAERQETIPLTDRDRHA